LEIIADKSSPMTFTVLAADTVAVYLRAQIEAASRLDVYAVLGQGF